MNILKKIIKELVKPEVNNFKGTIGESKVDYKLNSVFSDKIEHRQINNMIIIDENGKSHQIDHIEIRENGIFCIETKNYTGWIFGNENQIKWTQILYSEKHQFFNPLKQNKSHIYHLSKIIDKKYHINSIVVMVQNNAERINCKNVVNLIDLKSYLNNYNDGTKLSIQEMNEIYNKFITAQSNISNKEHLQNIKQTKNELKQGICPRCGSKLVERTGKYGSFYGCSNYPKCKFILKKDNKKE